MKSQPTDKHEAARRKHLPFAPPNITDEEVDAVVAALRSGWITTGPQTRAFEEAFAAYVGCPAALAVSSCTAALHVALVALGVGPGDGVVVPAITFCSTVHVIEQVGARPILVDVETDTLTIDPSAVRAAIAREATGPNPIKVILPVHLYGHPAALDEVYEIAAETGCSILEDAAHALPAAFMGETIGSARLPNRYGVTAMVAFSFYATKNMTTGEGGMLTGPADLLEHARVLSLHGMSRDSYNRYTAAGSWHYEVVAAGFKYNMTDIQAALGLVQLARLPRLQARRREIVQIYSRGLKNNLEVEVPVERPDVDSAWHIFAIRLRLDCLKIDRSEFIRQLTFRRIGSSVHFIPIHHHTYYRQKYGWEPRSYPVTESEYPRLVSLPIYAGLSDADLEDVVTAVNSITAMSRT